MADKATKVREAELVVRVLSAACGGEWVCERPALKSLTLEELGAQRRTLLDKSKRALLQESSVPIKFMAMLLNIQQDSHARAHACGSHMQAEVAALTAALGQSPDYKLDVRNAVMEAKRAADAVAVARADTAAQASFARLIAPWYLSLPRGHLCSFLWTSKVTCASLVCIYINMYIPFPGKRAHMQKSAGADPERPVILQAAPPPGSYARRQMRLQTCSACCQAWPRAKRSAGWPSKWATCSTIWWTCARSCAMAVLTMSAGSLLSMNG
eukprot:scaffold51096_cov20-Tisochrysis_lutea.AAC.1